MLIKFTTIETWNFVEISLVIMFHSSLDQKRSPNRLNYSKAFTLFLIRFMIYCFWFSIFCHKYCIESWIFVRMTLTHVNNFILTWHNSKHEHFHHHHRISLTISFLSVAVLIVVIAQHSVSLLEDLKVEEDFCCIKQVFYHDKIPCHTPLLISDSKNIPIRSHPSYSPDFAPCQFWHYRNKNRKTYWDHSRHWKGNENAAEGLFERTLLQMLLIMESRLSTLREMT